MVRLYTIRSVRGFAKAKWRCAILALYVALTAGMAYGQDASPTQEAVSYDYESFAQTVAKAHPEGAADRQQREIASLAPNVAGTLPDPTVTVGRSGIELKESENQSMEMGAAAAPMKAWSVGVSQMFPWPGTLSAAKEAAEAQAEAATSTYDLGQLRRYLAAKDLYLDMAYAQEKLRIESDNIREARKLLEFSEERFRQGVGSHMDVLVSRSELALLQANFASLETTLENLKANAAIMLGRAPANPPKFDLSFLSETPPAQRESRKSQVRQDLVQKAIKAQSASATASKREMALRTMPNFSLSTTVANMESGEQSLSVMAGVSVPIFSTRKRRALTAQAERIQQETSSRLDWHQAQKELALVQLKNRRARLEDNLEVLRAEVIPMMQEHLEKALVEYSQGKGALRDIVDSQQILLRQQIASLTTRKELARSDLAATRIEAGLFQSEINPTVSTLPLTLSGSMSGGMEGMQDMNGLNSGRMNGREMNGSPSSAPSMPGMGQDIGGESEGESEMPAGGMPGMGM